MTLQATVSSSNSKLGMSAQMGAFSITPGVTCPGATEWCAAACYAKSPYARYTNTTTAWDRNTEATAAGVMPRIPASVTMFRIHVGGDFFSAPYIRQWITLVRSRPDVKFWAYTRSWRVPRLLKALEDLRAEPNMQLFASIDDSTHETPPAGWRVAAIGGQHANTGDPAARPGGEAAVGLRPRGIACPEQTGAKSSCAACGYCFKGKRGDVTFAVH